MNTRAIGECGTSAWRAAKSLECGKLERLDGTDSQINGKLSLLALGNAGVAGCCFIEDAKRRIGVRGSPRGDSLCPGEGCDVAASLNYAATVIADGREGVSSE